MEEVIAKRRNIAGAGYIAVVLIGLVLLIGGIIVGVEADQPGAIVITLAVGGFLIGMGVYLLVKFFMLPSKVIVYKDGLLYLPYKVTCRPEELERVFIKVYKRYGVVSKYGKMEVTVRGKMYKYNDIANVQEAQDRLAELNRIAVDNLRRQTADGSGSSGDPSAEPTAAAEANKPENPFKY